MFCLAPSAVRRFQRSICPYRSALRSPTSLSPFPPQQSTPLIHLDWQCGRSKCRFCPDDRPPRMVQLGDVYPQLSSVCVSLWPHWLAAGCCLVRRLAGAHAIAAHRDSSLWPASPIPSRIPFTWFGSLLPQLPGGRPAVAATALKNLQADSRPLPRALLRRHPPHSHPP